MDGQLVTRLISVNLMALMKIKASSSIEFSQVIKEICDITGQDIQVLKDDINQLIMKQSGYGPLEAALIFMADRCDGAASEDGKGFNKLDAVFGKAMARKILQGQRLSRHEYNNVYAMLKRYNNQLADGGMDIRLIPKEQEIPEEAIVGETLPSKEAIIQAREILALGNPIKEHVDYATKIKKVHNGETAARVITMSSYSGYLPINDRLHLDVAGSSQIGKSKRVTVVLETFPEKNVLILSEASPKSIYYFADANPEGLKDLIIYLDDTREEHIPVLKTFRNEGNVPPGNLTVGDNKESVLQKVPYRPVIIASSVNPLRDLEQQVGSRALLISIPDATPEEEKEVHKAIRAAKRTEAITCRKTDTKRDVLRAMAYILREEGIRDILVPFDAKEPEDADRRGTAQFMKLIKISAFINQFQRPILELTDGRKFVLAVYEDLKTAATVWFDFAAGQEFKISAKAIGILKELPTECPGITAPTLANGKSQRTIERYLENLFEAGIVSRERIKAPGMPYGYWCDESMRQKVLSKISESGDIALDSDTIPTNNLCRKYMAEKSSDSLKDSIIEFFSNKDIIDKEMYKGIWDKGVLQNGNAEKIYLALFSSKIVSEFKNVVSDSE
jgi:hypothetical protein